MNIKRDTVRLLLYQLIEARRILADAAQGKDDVKELAGSYFFRMLAPSENDVNEFFATPEGARLAYQYKVK